MSYKTGADRSQRTLLPEYLEDYVSEENPVRFFDAFVNTLDMKQCGFERYVPASEGRPGYDPKDMLKLYVYGYFNRIRSSRLLMKETHRNLEVMWLINKLTPDFRTISDFRKNNAKALKEVFRAFNRFCDSLGLYSKELFAVDGSKFKAVNSKDNNFTLPKLDERIKKLDAQIDEYMKLIETTDAAEHDERKFTSEEVKEKLEKLTIKSTKYSTYRTELEASGKSQKSLTDPDSKLMKFSDKMDVGYNVQSAVDAKSHMIAGFEVTDHPSDNGLLHAMASSVKSDFNLNIIDSTADGGYVDHDDLMNCLESCIIPNVPTPENKDFIELETEYEPQNIDETLTQSKTPESVKKCLRAGIIPEIYKNIISEISVVEKVKSAAEHLEDFHPKTQEEMLQKARDGFFVRDIKRNLVFCPQGQILRQAAVLGSGRVEYRNKSVCRDCKDKCTKAKFKRVNFPAGQTLSVNFTNADESAKKVFSERMKKRRQAPRQSKQVVRLKFVPDKEKLDKRKTCAEHPFGTVKRALGASYFLLKGLEKVSAEIALAFIGFNLKRAINILGVPKLMESLN